MKNSIAGGNDIMNKISVIIPCCNVERWIDRCMTSITSQTIGMGNLEIICVDDASADDTWGHLKEWERSFPENVLKELFN